MSYKEKNSFICLIKGVFAACICTLLGVLIFSFIIKLAALSSAVIKPVNQFIKVISIFLGCFLFVRGKKGFVKGGAVGLLFTIAIYCLFALISGTSVFKNGFLLDLLFCLAIGILSGILTVNIKK